MTKKQAIQLFQKRKVRTVWDDELEEWYFCVVDVVEALTDSANPTDYIKKMKKRDPELAKGWGQIVTPLSLQTPGGRQRVNCANQEGLFRFKEGELTEEKVCRKFRHTTQHGVIEGLSQTQEVSTGIVEKVRKQDILVGKNYLNEDELKALKLIVEQYLAYAESQALAHRLLVIGNNDNYFENQ